jgi:hypothetical protein
MVHRVCSSLGVFRAMRDFKFLEPVGKELLVCCNSCNFTWNTACYCLTLVELQNNEQH